MNLVACVRASPLPSDLLEFRRCTLVMAGGGHF